MAKGDPPKSSATGTMAPWEGIDIGFSPANVAGAVGGFFAGSGNSSGNTQGRPLMANPSTYTAGGSSSGGGGTTRPAASAAPAKASTQHTSWGPPTSSAGASGMMQAAASPGSIIQRSIQTSLANRAGRRTGQTGTGMQSAAGAGLTTSAQRYPRLSMPTMTAGRQQAIDNRAVRQTSAERARDPLNWKGIARDLGNAGDARFAQYKTGAPASTNAMKLVGTQKSAAKAAGTQGRSLQSAARATKAAKRSKNANRAV
jgi:hypothetical protein